MRYFEFIFETTEESQVLNLVAKRMALKILEILDTKETLLKQILRAGEMSPKTKLTVFSIPAVELGIPLTNVKTVDDMLKGLTVQVNMDTDPNDNTYGYYVSGSKSKMIVIMLESLKTVTFLSGGIEKRSPEFIKLLSTVLVHELQHALDDYKSKGKYSNVDNTSHDLIGYLKRPYEVNARFQEALLNIATYMEEMKAQGSDVSVSDLHRFIRSSFYSNSLDRMLFFGDTKKFNRLLSRAYKFFDNELNNPKREQRMAFVNRAFNTILGKPTTQLK